MPPCLWVKGHLYLFESVQDLLSLAEVLEEELKSPWDKWSIVMHGEMNQHPKKHATSFIIDLQHAVALPAEKQTKAEYNMQLHDWDYLYVRCRNGKIMKKHKETTYPTPNIASACSPMYCKFIVAGKRECVYICLYCMFYVGHFWLQELISYLIGMTP